MSDPGKRRYEGLDILKCIGAFCVVCAHRRFRWEYFEYFRAVITVAVPLFFMITGFFYSGISEKGKALAQLKNVLWMNIWANLFYLVWGGMFSAIQGGSFSTYILKRMTVKKLTNFILFNVSPFRVHLWYLAALLYVLLIVFLLDKFGSRKWIYPVVPFLLVGDLLLGKYSRVLFGREFSYVYVRNFLFVGISYFCIGDMLWRCRDRIEKVFTKRRFVLIISAVLFTAMICAEHIFIVSSGLDTQREHYLGTTFLAVVLFILAYLYQKKTERAGLATQLANIGQKYSAMIYIIHPAIITLLDYIVKAGGERIPGKILTAYKNAGPVWIFILSLWAAVCINKIIRSVDLYIKGGKKS